MRVLLVGDRALLWEGVAHVLSTRGLSRSITRLPSIADAVRHVSRHNPDVVVVQSRHSDGSGADAVRRLRSASDGLRIVVFGVSDWNEEAFLAALEEGASGFVDGTASSDDLLDCVRRVGQGHTYVPGSLAVRLAAEYRERASRPPGGTCLTDRELEVLKLLAQGHANKVMAQRLVVSEHTVRAHLRNIMRKLNAENRVQAVARANREGLLPDDDLPLAEKDDSALTA